MRTNTAFVASLVGAATALPLLGNEHRVESVNGLANNVDSLVGSKGLASDVSQSSHSELMTGIQHPDTISSSTSSVA
jgi:hypothetical protein